jgi:alkylated DNA repair dioxygenase AlkB
MDLCDDPTAWPTLPLPDASVALLPQLALPLPFELVLAQLIAETPWRAEFITLWGKRMAQPRLTSWHGEASYTYSGLRLDPLPFTPLQQLIKDAVEAASGARFNSVLLNYYRDGRDSMGMHSDDEAELGPEPVIASFSVGATRPFILRHKRTRETFKVELPSGSLLLMAGSTQACWQHGINKTARPVGARVNLTFRRIVSHA